MTIADAFEATDWFAARTPLSSFDSLVAITRHPCEPAEEVSRLRDAVRGGAVRAALELASPGFLTRAAAAGLFSNVASGKLASLPDGLAGTLYRYVARMAWRCTPFGLFAATSLGTIDRRPSRLALDPLSVGRVHVTPHTTQVLRCVSQTSKVLPDTIRYRLNSSLYRVGSCVRFAEFPRGETAPASVVEVKASERLTTLLSLFHDQDCMTLAEIAERGGCTRTYVASLIEIGLLVSDAFPSPTSGDALLDAMDRAKRRGFALPASLAELAQRTSLRQEELTKALVSPSSLETRILSAEDGLAVDFHRSGELHLHTQIAREALRAIDTLSRFTKRNDDHALERFRERFVRRFGTRAVPLGIALDPDHGVPFGGQSGEEAAWVHGVPLGERTERTQSWGFLDEARLQLLLEATATRQPIDLLDGRKLPPPLDLRVPESFVAVVQVLARDQGALAHHDVRVLFRGAVSPSGLQMLGRFCGANRELRARVEQHAKAEQERNPNVILADVAHEPTTNPEGNILQRPPMRAFELVYRAVPGVGPEQRLTIDTLTLRVEGDRFVLWSLVHDKEVRVRNMNAHLRTLSHLPTYAFLLALGASDSSLPSTWDWGPLETAPWLPRICAGKSILVLERWNPRPEEFDRAISPREAVDRVRMRHQLPRWVVIRLGDKAYPVDLQSELGAAALTHAFRGEGANHTFLEECVPGEGDLCTLDGDALLTHELAIPFLRRQVTAAPCGSPFRASTSPVVYPPGSDWVFLKIYCALTQADGVIQSVSRLLSSQGPASAFCWHFLRYADPEFHIRFRFRSADQNALLTAQVLEHGKQLCDAGIAWRIQMDTYVPELERYGGERGIALFHAFSSFDSAAVHAALPRLRNREARIAATIIFLDRYASAFAFDDALQLGLIDACRDTCGEYLRATTATRAELSKRYRIRESELARLVMNESEANPDEEPWPTVRRLAQGARSELRGALEELDDPKKMGGSPSIIGSLLHMHTNRMGLSMLEEFAAYDALARLYRTRARRRNASRDIKR